MDTKTLCNLVSIMKKKLIPTSKNKAFSQLTTLGVGGKIKLVIYPPTIRKFAFAVKTLKSLNLQYVILGKGSNILAADGDFDGVAVSTQKLNRVKIRGCNVTAYAGTSTIYLAKLLQQSCLGGGEFMACLPASVGGATVCNAGCFSQDMRSVIKRVTVLYKGRICRLNAEDCGFDKRTSIFKNSDKYAVLSVSFRFCKTTPCDIADKISDIKAKKFASQPLNYRSAGCVLYHDKVAVSRLIDEAGLKGYAVGGAKISEKHAGFVVNVDKACSKDIYLIIRHIIQTLKFRYGVTAKVEVCLINFTKDEQNDLFAGS